MNCIGTDSGETLTLDEVCMFIVDCLHKTAPTQLTGYPSIRTPNVGRGRLLLDGVNRVSESVYAEWTKRAIPEPGDLILAREAPAGNVAIIREGQTVCLGQRTVHLRPDREKVDPDFLCYYLLAPRQQGALLAGETGATAGHVNMRDIRRLNLDALPTVQEQQRRGEIISAYDDLIENNRRRIVLLEEAARLLYREWFVHFRFPGHEHVKIIGGIPDGWERRALGDVVEIVKNSVKPSDFEEHDIHIGLEHIPRRSFTLANWESAEDLASGKWRFEEGDILFCKIRPYFHKVGFAPKKGLASSDALVWRVRDETDWPIVLCATSSDHFVAVASKTVREGSKMPRADWKALRDYVVPRPSEDLLEIFNETIQAIAAKCKTLALQSRALAEARDLLLPRLMNGQIAV